MISASHNPYEDNGIKLFGPDGLKLSDAEEVQIEALMGSADLADHLASPGKLGRASRIEDAPGRYIEAAKSTFPKGRSLEGKRIVLDCANGAAYKVAPTVLWELGAEVVSVAVAPDGLNINRECGATAPQKLAELVKERRADLGIALDGDADRLVLSDEQGRIVDGDQILALIAGSWHRDGRLRGGGIVATVMSNLGLERHMQAMGLALHRAKVGDRYVAEVMRETGCNLGGEQSGHMILSDFATTGDGLVAALQVLALLVEEERPASEVCRRFDPLPQKLVNIRFAGASPLGDAEVQRAIEAAGQKLGSRGRVLVRASGTEPLIRVMAEAEDEAEMQATVDGLAALIRARAAAGAARKVQAAE
jgi:phosphoglucosamine mutase